MIKLHQYPTSWNLPSTSPFCIKVELYLKITNIDYQIVWESNPNRGPKNKMPFIEDGEQVVADSSFIIEYLQQKYQIALDDNLSATDKAVMLAFQKLIEENLYWVLLYSRWGDDQGWPVIRREFAPMLPPVIGSWILKLIRKNLLRQAYQQGIGRHSQQEIYQIGHESITALADFLADKKFFMGDKIHTIDTTVYSFLVTILDAPMDTALYRSSKSFSNLTQYCTTIKNTYFS